VTRGMIARSILVAIFFLFAVTLAAPVSAQERPSKAACERSKFTGRGYVECLEKHSRDANDALEDLVTKIRAAIDARAELAPVQKNRWKNAIEESQVLYVRFRNQECQAVAPYEGANNRIGAFEERLACLIDKNVGRARELEARYGK
jgi:uncharacterized protein YecT (DUF1311 family)